MHPGKISRHARPPSPTAGTGAAESSSRSAPLAQEAAPPVQRAGAAPSTQSNLEVSPPGAHAELEAASAAAPMVRGDPARVSPPGGLARKISPAPPGQTPAPPAAATDAFSDAD